MERFHFPCFLSWAAHLSAQHLCLARVPLSPLSWEVQLKLFLNFVLIRAAGRKRNRIFPLRRKKAENSFILTGKGRLKHALPRTRKLITLFLFEVHCPKYQDKHIPWWQHLSHSCTKKKNTPAGKLSDTKSCQIVLMSTDALTLYPAKSGRHKSHTVRS